MEAFITFIDRVSMWFGKAFAWLILVMTFGMSYEVVVRYVFRSPAAWAFDISYMMYGTLFMMAGAYTLSRNAHVRADFVYRLWPARVQAGIELVLYFVLFFPGILALIIAGWRYASRSFRYMEESVFSPAGVPIYQFKAIIVIAGTLALIQGIAQVCRCIVCLRTGVWPRQIEDVEELEEVLIKEHEREILSHHGEAIDVVVPHSDAGSDGDGRG